MAWKKSQDSLWTPAKRRAQSRKIREALAKKRIAKAEPLETILTPTPDAGRAAFDAVVHKRAMEIVQEWCRG